MRPEKSATLHLGAPLEDFIEGADRESSNVVL